KTMKILTNEEYNNLIQQIKKLEYENDSLNYKIGGLSGTVQNLHNELENINIRRVIVGRNGSGKTTYIKNRIIPKLSNYFLIDTHNEYPDVPDDKKLSNCSRQPELIYETILSNKDKVIIVEDANILYVDTKFMYKLISILSDSRLQFIFVYQSYQHAEWMKDFFNIVYNFGAADGLPNNNFNHKIILKKFKA